MKSTAWRLLTAVAVVVWSGGALAGTDHRMHGSDCFVTGGTASWTQVGISSTSLSGGVTMICPLPDSWNSAAVGTSFGISFVGYDRNSTSDVDCNLIMTDANGGLLAILDAHSTGSASGPMSFPMIGTTTGFGYIGCLVPAKSTFGPSFFTSYTVNL